VFLHDTMAGLLFFLWHFCSATKNSFCNPDCRLIQDHSNMRGKPGVCRMGDTTGIDHKQIGFVVELLVGSYCPFPLTK